MIFVSDECVEVYDFSKTCLRMCTNINNYVPVRPWFDDPDEEEQWECDYRDDMIAPFQQDLFNKSFTLQGQGKEDEIYTLEKRIKFWPNIISIVQGPVPDRFYDYSDEGLDKSVHGAEIFPNRRERKKLFDILRSEWLRKQLKLF